MNNSDVLDKLRKLITFKYNQVAMAKDAGVSSAYINAVLNGHKPPSNKVLSLIGLKKTVTTTVKEEFTPNE